MPVLHRMDKQEHGCRPRRRLQRHHIFPEYSVRKNVGLPMILWSVDTRDWETRSTPTTITRVVDGAYDGAVILVHDLHESTAIASKTFIPRLIKNGYQLVTISEMAELRGITMKAGETYNSFR